VNGALVPLGPFSIVFAVGGGLWGLAADRLASRWPAHEDGVQRGLDWRTAAVVCLGALAIGALPGRFGEARDLAVMVVWFAALTMLLATDLDQRVLPDEITLPLVPLALVVLLGGWDPVLADKSLGVQSGLAAGVLVPLFLGITSLLFGAAARAQDPLGMGDLKLAASLGLVSGVSQLVAGFVLASAAFGLLLVGLLVSRRVSLRGFVPFGPVLILAGFLAVIRGPVW
jgi:leader peptidase (prepilin peptidase)/N-methyltransferase